MTDVHILLTGGTGFFGRALLRHFKILGDRAPEVTIISRNPQRFISRHPDLARLARWISADILEVDSLPRNLRCSHIIHAAADYSAENKEVLFDQYKQIVDGTHNILKLGVDMCVSRFLFISSGAVYGITPVGLDFIPETYNGMPDPLNPRNVYGVAKRTAEHLCTLFQEEYGIETISARCFSFIGRDLPLNANFAAGNFIRDALWRPEIIVRGDGSEIRSYLHQSDLAVWLILLLFKGKAGTAYNIGSDQSITLLDLACLIRDVLSPKKEVKRLHETSADNSVRPRYVPDITRMRSEFNISAFCQLETAIRLSALTLGE